MGTLHPERFRCAGSNQLLHRFSPVATILLLVAAPATERIIGSSNAEAQFQLTGQAFAVITASACLGLLVSLSTFLVIGHTSALTYNVVGHIKTVGVIAGGVFFYGEVRCAAYMADHHSTNQMCLLGSSFYLITPVLFCTLSIYFQCALQPSLFHWLFYAVRQTVVERHMNA